MKTSLRYRLVKVAKLLGVRFNPEQDEAVAILNKEIRDLKGIQFSIERYPNGDWMAQSTNIDGILTGGTASDDVDDMIKDAILAYYGVSPKYADDLDIQAIGEAKVTKQEVIAVA